MAERLLVFASCLLLWWHLAPAFVARGPSYPLRQNHFIERERERAVLEDGGGRGGSTRKIERIRSRTRACASPPRLLDVPLNNAIGNFFEDREVDESMSFIQCYMLALGEVQGTQVGTWFGRGSMQPVQLSMHWSSNQHSTQIM